MAASASERRSFIWNAFASALRTAPPPKGAALRVQGAGCRVQNHLLNPLLNHLEG